METLFVIALGLALSAACGFRVFLPLLVLGAAGATGQVTLMKGFEWLASTPALIALSVATAAEIAAYYVPWVDNVLDTLAGPAAVVAGIVVTASVVDDTDPVLRWGLAIVAGGGIAGTVQASTSLLRLTSTALTGGIGNPLISTAELGGAVAVSLAALVMPIAALALLFLGLLFSLPWLIGKLRRQRRGERPAAVQV